LQAIVDAESRRSKILSKMNAETVFFAQLFVFGLLLIGIYFYSNNKNIHLLISLFISLPYSIYGMTNAATRRLIKAERYELSHNETNNEES